MFLLVSLDRFSQIIESGVPVIYSSLIAISALPLLVKHLYLHGWCIGWLLEINFVNVSQIADKI